MLPKINRLTKKKDFTAVFKTGQSVKNDFLLVKIAKNHLKESRFGFVVSKKVSSKATQRNKVKRRLRKAVADELKKIKSPVDAVIVVLPNIKAKEFSQIQEIVVGIFKKVKLT